MQKLSGLRVLRVQFSPDVKYNLSIQLSWQSSRLLIYWSQVRILLWALIFVGKIDVKNLDSSSKLSGVSGQNITLNNSKLTLAYQQYQIDILKLWSVRYISSFELGLQMIKQRYDNLAFNEFNASHLFCLYDCSLFVIIDQSGCSCRHTRLVINSN